MNILITGARGGIGYATALQLAQQGHHVITTVRTEEQKKLLQADPAVAQTSITVDVCDITKADDCQRIAQHDIDVLICNAGTGQAGPLTVIPIQLVRQVTEVNVFGTLQLIQVVAPQMIKKTSGRIIIVSSIVGKIAIPYLGAYTQSKFALEAVGDSLRRELKPYGVHVSLIEPGAIATGFNEQMWQSRHAWWQPSELLIQDDATMNQFEKNLLADQKAVTGVVAAMHHAVTARRPKPRYPAPFSTKILALLTAITPSRMLDIILTKIFRKK